MRAVCVQRAAYQAVLHIKHTCLNNDLGRVRVDLVLLQDKRTFSALDVAVGALENLVLSADSLLTSCKLKASEGGL